MCRKKIGLVSDNNNNDSRVGTVSSVIILPWKKDLLSLFSSADGE